MEQLEESKIIQHKPFPPTWNTIILDPVNALSNPRPSFELLNFEDNKDPEIDKMVKEIDWSQFLEEAYHRVKENPNCGIFKGVADVSVHIRKTPNKYLFGYDVFSGEGKMKGIFGIMRIGFIFLMEDRKTGKYHLTFFVLWRCSLTFSKENETYYGNLKDQFDISAGKYLQIELMKLMKYLLAHPEELQEITSSQFRHFSSSLTLENLQNVSHITVLSHSLDTALPFHLKNGAKMMSQEQIENYKIISNRSFSLIEDILTSKDDSTLIYWNEKV